LLNTTGNYNTASGANALEINSTGDYNTADGYYALNQTTTGEHNTTSGFDALRYNTTGYWNTATGSGALISNTTGIANTAIGYGALTWNATASYNTASGFKALYSNTTGEKNTASGSYALYKNTTASYSTASGHAALFSNTTGDANTAFGDHALSGNTTGFQNVAVGASALNLITGSNNIALGTLAGAKTTSGNNNIYIGHQGINGSESKVIRIGQGQTRTFVAGIAGTALSGATVVVRANGQLGVVASSSRYKQDIEPLGGTAASMAEKLARLRPVSYRYKTEPEATHYGLIAEEVDRVMPELVVRDDQNRPETVQYQELIPLLLHQWKAQQADIARLRTEVAHQHAVNKRQEAALTELRRSLATRLAALDAADRGDRTGSK